MSNDTLITTRYSADHSRRIEVHYKIEPADFVYEDMKNAGCEVFVKQHEFRRAFSLEEIDFQSRESIAAFEREAKAAELAALMAGDPIIFVRFGEHGCQWVEFNEKDSQPSQFYDCWRNGFLVFKREAWNRFFWRETAMFEIDRPEVLARKVQALH